MQYYCLLTSLFCLAAFVPSAQGAPLMDVPASLHVELATMNPPSGTIGKGSPAVTMLSLRLTASCDADVVIHDITLVHEGSGDAKDIVKVYAVSGRKVHSNKRPIDPENMTVTLRLPRLRIPKCQDRVIDIKADIARSARSGRTHSLLLELPTDIQTDVQTAITGAFPIKGSEFTVAAKTKQ